VNVLLIIPIVIGIISLWSLFLTATSDPGVHLRSSDPGARPRPRAPPPRPACPRDARRRAAIVDEADRRDQATGWRFTCGSMDGELRDLKFCRAAPAPPRPCRAPPAGSSRAAVAADQARARSSARRARRTATSATTASRASTTTAPGERPRPRPWLPALCPRRSRPAAVCLLRRVGTCIGERNYRQFCIFVFSTALVTLYCVVASIWQVRRAAQPEGRGKRRNWAFSALDRNSRNTKMWAQIARDEGSLNERLQKHWAGCAHRSAPRRATPPRPACADALRRRRMFCACYGCLFSLFIEVLAACHCCLVCKGVTTKEWVRLHVGLSCAAVPLTAPPPRLRSTTCARRARATAGLSSRASASPSSARCAWPLTSPSSVRAQPALPRRARLSRALPPARRLGRRGPP